MKCKNCNSAEYQNTYDSFRDNGIIQLRYECPICGDEHFISTK